MDEVQQGLRYLFQTDSKYTLCASGTGHSGMEMAIANLVERGETVVVGNNGIWVRGAPAWVLLRLCRVLESWHISWRGRARAAA